MTHPVKKREIGDLLRHNGIDCIVTGKRVSGRTSMTTYQLHTIDRWRNRGWHSEAELDEATSLKLVEVPG